MYRVKWSTCIIMVDMCNLQKFNIASLDKTNANYFSHVHRVASVKMYLNKKEKEGERELREEKGR